jgi:hypothetical protein
VADPFDALFGDGIVKAGEAAVDALTLGPQRRKIQQEDEFASAFADGAVEAGKALLGVPDKPAVPKWAQGATRGEKERYSGNALQPSPAAWRIQYDAPPTLPPEERPLPWTNIVPAGPSQEQRTGTPYRRISVAEARSLAVKPGPLAGLGAGEIIPRLD